MQQTSIISFQNLQIGNRQKIVLNAFMKYGACSNLEISTWSNIPINQVTPRTNELVKLGLIKESHKRRCSISSRYAIVWHIV